VADGFSLLEAQQRAADEIPYRNIEVNQRATEGAMNAFRYAQEINLRKGALQKQLMMMADRQRQMEFMNELREAQFNQRQEYQNARLGQYETALYLKGLMDQSEITMRDKKLELIGDKLKDTQNFDNYMLELGEKARPGNPDYPASWRAAHILYPNANVNEREMYQSHASAIDKVTKGLDAEERSLGNDLKSRGMTPDLTPFRDPDHWFFRDYQTKPSPEETLENKKAGEPKPRNAPKADFVMDEHGMPVRAGDSWSIKTPGPIDSTTGQPSVIYRHFKDNELRNYISKVESLDKRRREVPDADPVPTSPGDAIFIGNDADYNALPHGHKFYYKRDDGTLYGGTKP
jgi:hypothetical protein